MNYLVYAVAAVALLYVVLVTVVMVLSVRKMRQPEGLLETVNEPQRLDAFPEVVEWADAQGFELNSQFLFDGLVGAGGMKMAVEGWFNPSRNLFLMYYHVQNKRYFEFISGLEGGYSLASSCSKDSLSLPFPEKVFCQAFDNTSLDELFSAHLKALEFFETHFGVKAVAPDLPLRSLITRSISKQMSYVQGLPFWYLRGAWWHLVRRRQLANKSIIDVIQNL